MVMTYKAIHFISKVVGYLDMCLTPKAWYNTASFHDDNSPHISSNRLKLGEVVFESTHL